MVMLGFPRRIIYNEDAPRALLELLSHRGSKAVLIVTDNRLVSASWFKDILEALSGSGIRYCVYSNVEPEPGMEVGDQVASAARKCGADAIIAVGGGSVIDATKAGAVKLVNPSIRLDSIAPFVDLGLEGSRITLVAIPTTSGSGSDASYGIVLSRIGESGREKVAVGSYEVIPYASILDPSIPAGMPRSLTIATGVDVLAHSLESLVSTGSNPLSDALAVKAAEIVFTRLPRIVEDPGDLEARAEMHLAATMAGMAFTNSGLGLAHAIAHPLGARLGTHHGATVGVVLPHVVRFNYSNSQARAKYEYLKSILEAVAGLPRRETLVSHIEWLYDRIGQPYRISKLTGISREEYLEVSRIVAEEALRDPDIAFNPIIPTPEEIEGILRSMY